jgi:hypothetical protein
MPQMLDRPDDLLDIISGSAQRNLTLYRVISRPGGSFVVSAWQTHASDVDDCLAAHLEAIDA